MTIDERIEFLMQSIESHDRQIAELVENGAKVDGRLDSLTANMEKLRETTQLNFDRLTQAMMGLTDHIVDHRRRITDLEGGRS
jgi:DNA repair ATPase RecN